MGLPFLQPTVWLWRAWRRTCPSRAGVHACGVCACVRACGMCALLCSWLWRLLRLAGMTEACPAPAVSFLCGQPTGLWSTPSPGAQRPRPFIPAGPTWPRAAHVTDDDGPPAPRDGRDRWIQAAALSSFLRSLPPTLEGVWVGAWGQNSETLCPWSEGGGSWGLWPQVDGHLHEQTEQINHQRSEAHVLAAPASSVPNTRLPGGRCQRGRSPGSRAARSGHRVTGLHLCTWQGLHVGGAARELVLVGVWVAVDPGYRR